MGSLHAQEFADSVKRKDVTLLVALEWHLQANHYPPVPISFVPVCIKAIEHANAGEYDAFVKLPPGCTFRGHETAPVGEIVRQHHLESFLSQEEE